ncbi:MAG: N-acetylmuramoyl-L-alanine amidase [Chloroflexota bacterium]
MKTLSVWLLLVLTMLALTGCETVDYLDAAGPADAAIADIVLSSTDFVAQTAEGMTVTEDGLSQESIVTSGIFVSQPLEAPIDFNAVVPQWIQDLPDAAAMELQLRTSADGRTWGPWYHVHAQIDWMREGDPDTVGEMILVPSEDETHRFVQYMITSEGAGLASPPQLRELRFTFIDSTQGPTAESLMARQEALESLAGESEESLTGTTDGFPKPFVVSRSVWCQHPDCVYSDGLEYSPVTHLIVHHTVSSNTSTNWAAVVRAIWNFHTYSRGWGDIGYNYLVDPDGVIYEGHFGGDDVVGTHASGANAGTMAVALIGTFTDPEDNPPGIIPPSPMVDSAVNLLSWKADQRDINVFDASDTLPNIDWGLPNLMGHRDVYGTTECPGDQAHRLLPSMRERVAQNIGLVDNNIYVDELSTGFTSSNSNWLVPPYQCGYDLHAFYTWSTDDPADSSNWGEWRPSVPATGRYAIDAYVPYCRTGRSETSGATYTVTHADGVTDVTVDQNAQVGLWIPLGEYNLNAGNSTVIRLTDLSTTDSGLGVWFDALRLRPLDALPTPEISNVDPRQDDWQNQRVINFDWQIINPEAVTQTRLQVSSDENFTTLVTDQSWPGAVSSTSVDFNTDYPELFWRVSVDWTGGAPVVGPSGRMRLDATPPDSSILQPQYVYWTRSFRLNWSGQDALSGIVAYNVDFRPEGENWVRWLSNTTLTGANFIAPDPSRVYEFRSQAIDVAGNIEPVTDTADVATTQAIRLGNSLLLPMATVP